jgi:membrane protein
MKKFTPIKFEKIPVIRDIVRYLDSVKLSWLEGMTLYELIALYIKGIAEGAVSYRAGSIAFSFIMALFPFALFILNLLPLIPIEGFQQDFLRFVEESVPPNTYQAIATIISDILNNSNSGLASWAFVLSIFLQANGMSAILGGFEHSKHVTDKRGFVRQYLVSLGLSLVLTFILILTVATIVVFEVFLQMTKIQDVFSDKIPLLVVGRYVFVILMILITTSLLLKFGTLRKGGKRSFISIGSVFTTILVVILSYIFGIWVVEFSKYNELYGSIGTLLVMMFYIWINCMILLLGFELNAIIHKHKRRNDAAQAGLEDK